MKVLPKVKRGTTTQEVYAKYMTYVENLRKRGLDKRNKQLKPLLPDSEELEEIENLKVRLALIANEKQKLYVMLKALNPSSKKPSLDLTYKLIEVMTERKAVTIQELQDDFGWSPRAIGRRMKIFMEHGLVHREAKKYYLATPRMEEFKEKFMHTIYDPEAILK